MGTRSRSSEDVARGTGELTRLGGQAQAFVRWCGKWAQVNGTGSKSLVSLSIYPPSASRNGQWLIVGKAFDGGYRFVAFHRSTDPLTALVGFFQRWAEGKLTWKPDEWRKD